MDGVLTNWSEVVRVTKGEPIIADPEVFTRDLVARVSVLDQANGFVYSLDINGQVFQHTRAIGETNSEVLNNLLSQVQGYRPLWGVIEAFLTQNGDEFEIFAEHCFDQIPISTIGLSIESGTPLEQGIRSRILLDAARNAPVSVFGPDTTEAQTLLAAHFAAQAVAPGPGKGTIASQSFGSESIAWTMPTNNPRADGEILMTLYGKRFVKLRKRNIIPAVVG